MILVHKMNTMIPYVTTHYKFIINHNSNTIITYFMVETELLMNLFYLILTSALWLYLFSR